MDVRKFLMVLTLCTGAGCALSQTTPVGLWKTFDEDTKRETALVRVSQNAGVYSGVVERVLESDREHAVCAKCTDERKDKPVLGMTVLRDVRQSADSIDVWDGGSVLEVKQGKVYKVELKLANNGQALEVRGYVGAPIFGRSRIWQRLE